MSHLFRSLSRTLISARCCQHVPSVSVRCSSNLHQPNKQIAFPFTINLRSPPSPPSTLPPTTTSFDELLNRMILQHSPSPPTQPFPLNLIVDAIYRPTITTPTPTATPTATPTYSLLNRNARKPRRANAGKRPCSHVARRKKRRKNGSWRRGH